MSALLQVTEPAIFFCHVRFRCKNSKLLALEKESMRLADTCVMQSDFEEGLGETFWSYLQLTPGGIHIKLLSTRLFLITFY